VPDHKSSAAPARAGVLTAQACRSGCAWNFQLVSFVSWRGDARIERLLGMARRLGTNHGAHVAAKNNREESLKPGKTLSRAFSDIAQITSREAGRAWVFALAVATILVWAISGPLFQFSDTWQLVINTGTTIVTFLMVFLIQNSQNRDGAAIQVKLDELIRVSKAQNIFVGVEHLTDQELEDIRTRCESRAKAEATRRAGRVH
jgi:low affinity Fe/Cu permease